MWNCGKPSGAASTMVALLRRRARLPRQRTRM